MVALRFSPYSTVEQKLRKGGLTGIALGVVALLACELPVVLTLLGVGTLAASANALKPPFWIEIIGIASAVVGLLMLIVVIFRHWRRRNE
ncbi:MAG: hypothetical protein ACR2P1_09170 [Pseudomonadales bacterium]